MRIKSGPFSGWLTVTVGKGKCPFTHSRQLTSESLVEWPSIEETKSWVSCSGSIGTEQKLQQGQELNRGFGRESHSEEEKGVI